MKTLSLTTCSLISETQSWHTPVRVKATAIAMPATQIRLFGYDNSEHTASSFKGSTQTM
jgi:hypothetical protein